MRKLVIIPLIVAVGLMSVSAFYYNGYIPSTVQSYGFSPVFDETELMEKSLISVEGRIVGQETELEFIRNGPIDQPYVWTTWTLKTVDKVKGNPPEFIEFKTSGGKYKNIEHITSGPEIKMGQKVLVFLSKDPDSQYGDAYYLTGISSGLYEIDSKGNAKNKMKGTSENIEQLKGKLRTVGP